MDVIKNEVQIKLENELLNLKELSDTIRKQSKQGKSTVRNGSAAKRYIRVSTSQGHQRFYVPMENGSYKYVKKKDLPKLVSTLQAEYWDEAEHFIQKQIHRLESALSILPSGNIDDVYEHMHPAKQAYITPIQQTSKQAYEQWLQESYPPKFMGEDVPLILTERGEHVRSKSEKILADYFYHQGIEYKYEKPLMLPGIGTVHPDFTFWSKRLNQEIYWEHDGMMGNEEYSNFAVRKINTYIRNGILPKDRLILTYETATTPLDMDCVKQLVKHYLLED